MTIDPAWALVDVTIFGILIGLVGTLWKFAKSVDRMNLTTASLEKTMAAQWKKIDEHGETIEEHSERLTKVETWKEIHDRMEREGRR